MPSNPSQNSSVISNVSMIFISIAIFGIFLSAIFPLYGACAGDYSEEEIVGTVLGGLTFIYGVGATAAPLVAGSLSDLTGTLRWDSHSLVLHR
jgi:MFS family permease